MHLFLPTLKLNIHLFFTTLRLTYNFFVYPKTLHTSVFLYPGAPQLLRPPRPGPCLNFGLLLVKPISTRGQIMPTTILWALSESSLPWCPCYPNSLHTYFFLYPSTLCTNLFSALRLCIHFCVLYSKTRVLRNIS